MSAEARLARITTALEAAGLECLVMGGHAVRYYGVGRNTNDFDLYVAAPSMDEVRRRLAAIPEVAPAREGRSWRPEDFARFEVGRLPDGREEWLEFWRHNHLLPDFAQTRARQERGPYGGRELGFLGLEDLIRSKETQREDDWADALLLEEIHDARHLVHVRDPGGPLRLLSGLRSRRGFERACALGLLADAGLVRRAIQVSNHPVSFAFLLPFARDAEQPEGLRLRVDEAYLRPLRQVGPGGVKHGALVEVVRRSYKRWAMEVDRRDKEAHGRHELSRAGKDLAPGEGLRGREHEKIDIPND